MNSIAAPSALIPARSGVPPSRPSGMRSAARCGPPGPSPASRTPVPPPGRNGASSGRTRRRAYSTPVPAIPNILRPEITAKSQPSSSTSTGMCPALWVQSRHSRTAGPSRPRSSSSVVSPPNTWCTWATVISLVRGETFGRDVGSVRLAGCGHRVRDQRDPPAEPGQHLPQVHPGVDVRGVVQRAVQDLVPVCQVGRAPGQRDSVQPRGGARREHDLLRARGAEEPGGLRADLGDPPRSAGRPRIGTAPGVGGLAARPR